MYIKKVEITNIRSIDHFEMTFDNPAGWHVLIGDNGSGKSSIVKAIALGLIGPLNIQAVRLPLVNWIQKKKNDATISINFQRHQDYDSHSINTSFKELKENIFQGLAKANKRLINTNSFGISLKLSREESNGFEIGVLRGTNNDPDPSELIWNGRKGWFSTAFGPFRRFTGGDKEWSKVYLSNPKAAAHLSIFGEDVALTESLDWLKQLKFESIESKSSEMLRHIFMFVNDSELLPVGIRLTDVTSAGVFFKDGNGFDIEITELSDGYRSLLSMTFELIRQLVKSYSEQDIFYAIEIGRIKIDVPGVVLIDEIDIHLHPTWQTRIGQWFTKYFPNIQFIVTTHSPLVCRACENGTIWRLAAPGSEMESGEVKGIEKDKLVFGNILDAYGTELFGESPVRSAKSKEKLARLGRLSMLAALGKISNEEEQERKDLQKILTTDDPTGY
jgi:predicted ATP-binding protein involved in virulence